MKNGWIPDSGKHPRRMFAGLGLGGQTPSGSADLRPNAPDNQDQYKCSSCVGHGTSCAVTTAFVIALIALFGTDENAKPIPISPRDPYMGGRIIDREEAGLPNTTQLQDEGTEVLSAMLWISRWGVRKTGAPSTFADPDTGETVTVNSDCTPYNVNDEPTQVELAQDALHIVPMPHQFTSSGDQLITDVCLALDAGHPIVEGGIVDSGFEAYTGGVVTAQNMNDPRRGGHCMCLLGYYTGPDGKRYFYGRNSWNKAWGLAGDFIADEAFVKQLVELFAVAVGSVQKDGSVRRLRRAS